MPYLHRSFFHKRALYLVAFLRKMTCNLRHPISLGRGHPAFHLRVHLFVFHHLDTHIEFAVKYDRMLPQKKLVSETKFFDVFTQAPCSFRGKSVKSVVRRAS